MAAAFSRSGKDATVSSYSAPETVARCTDACSAGLCGSTKVTVSVRNLPYQRTEDQILTFGRILVQELCSSLDLKQSKGKIISCMR